MGTKEITLSNAQNRRDITAFALDPEIIRILVEDCGYDDKTVGGYLNARVDKADGRSNELESTDPVDVFTGIPTFAKTDLDISGLIRLAKDALRMRETTIASIMLEECYVSFLSLAPGSRHLLYDHTYDVHRQKGIDFRKSESAIGEEMPVSGWQNAFEKVFRDGNRQFLPVSTLVEHVLFYGTPDILRGVWSGLFTEAIGKNPERHLALAVMGASPSAVIWILRKFPHWSPVHALNL
ncbi:hypothetical protein TWF103_011773 [Orbilia oligospora]|nr:hypothetical protein TWF103_011773 [Orbilia oligospora]